MVGSVGVDFGTSTTFVAMSDRRGATRVLPLGSVASSADLFLPSVVQPQVGGFVVGEAPSNQAAGVIRSVKRCITRDRQTASSAGADSVDVPADDVIRVILEEAVRRARKLEPKVFN